MHDETHRDLRLLALVLVVPLRVIGELLVVEVLRLRCQCTGSSPRRSPALAWYAAFRLVECCARSAAGGTRTGRYLSDSRWGKEGGRERRGEGVGVGGKEGLG